MNDTALTLNGRSDLAQKVAPISMRLTSEGPIPQNDIASIAEISKSTEFLAGGAFSTAYDLFRFAEMLRLGGTINGSRVLSPAIVNAARSVQTGNKLSGLYKDAAVANHIALFPANIGLSFYVRGDGIFLASMGTLSSPGTFGGQGFGGQLFWVDPERELILVHLVIGYPQLFETRKRSQRISDQVITAISD
jgi:CubicO group peptidase (beta-lactamase class C family)